MEPSTLCKHLRTKKMYVPAQADEAFAENNGETRHSEHCWCNRTLTEVGPDDRQVGFQICSRSRSCFEE
jgi:hypothetical protein